MCSGVGSAISGTQQCPHRVFLCKPSPHLDTDLLLPQLLCPSARGPGCREPPAAGALSTGARADYSHPLHTRQPGKVLRVTQLCPEGGGRVTGARSPLPVEPSNWTCIRRTTEMSTELSLCLLDTGLMSCFLLASGVLLCWVPPKWRNGPIPCPRRNPHRKHVTMRGDPSLRLGQVSLSH